MAVSLLLLIVLKLYKTYSLLLTVCLTAFLFSSCRSDTLTNEEIQLQIDALKSIDQQKSFLEEMLNNYQFILEKESELKKQGQLDSKQYKNLLKDKLRLEKVNLRKIAAYFETHGYPSRTKLGHYASVTPLVCVYYSTLPNAFNKDHFKYYYGAYKFNDIPNDFFLPYLQGLYESEKGKPYNKFVRPENQEEAIEDIMQELGFEI